jgi:hypothetical protein
VMNDQRNFRRRFDSRQRVAQAKGRRCRTEGTGFSYFSPTRHLRVYPGRGLELFDALARRANVGSNVD